MWSQTLQYWCIVQAWLACQNNISKGIWLVSYWVGFVTIWAIPYRFFIWCTGFRYNVSLHYCHFVDWTTSDSIVVMATKVRDRCLTEGDMTFFTLFGRGRCSLISVPNQIKTHVRNNRPFPLCFVWILNFVVMQSVQILSHIYSQLQDT